jgi:predicted amidohydrolase
LKAAAIQLNSTADKAANIAAADRLTRAAAAAGAELIVLPEKWTAIGRDDDLRAAAEELGGRVAGSGAGEAASVDAQAAGSGAGEAALAGVRAAGSGAGEAALAGVRAAGSGAGEAVSVDAQAAGSALSWACAIARELRIDLVAGSITERVPGREKLANTSVHVDPRGAIRAVYRKMHMFDVEIEGRTYRESDLEAAGDEIVLSQTAHGVELGMAICYDVRFPELFRILAIEGARVIALPAAFTLPTTRDHWEILVRARAIENQTFVIAANQVGSHPGGHHSGGRSMIVDPWGTVLAAAEDGEGHILAELDLERQREIRAQLPALANRRPSAYRWPQESRA